MKVVCFNRSIEKFLNSLEPRTKGKVNYAIRLLNKFGYSLDMPHSKKVMDNIFELRISSKQEVRIFYTFYNQEIVLLSGFIKDSNKIPSNEISKAIRRAKKLD